MGYENISSGKEDSCERFHPSMLHWLATRYRLLGTQHDASTLSALQSPEFLEDGRKTTFLYDSRSEALASPGSDCEWDTSSIANQDGIYLG